MNLKELEKIIALFEGSSLTELQVDEAELSIAMKKGGEALQYIPAPLPHAVSPSAVSADKAGHQEEPGKAQGKIDPNLRSIESPMVGTFYRSPSPTSNPYVSEGDHISTGQTLCIIEAMKLMNEIEADVSGKIVQILVENGTPVEYGQPLFLVEPL